jgi:hypothetical protein
MNRLLLRLVAALVALAAIGFAASAANAQTIQCPLTQATRSIIDPLPSEWWTTPIVSNLSDTRVTEISGIAALQCLYGTSGSIQREAPPNRTCTATSTGFSCVATLVIPPLIALLPGILSLIPTVQSSGNVNIGQSFAVNLDTGGVTGTAAADLRFRSVTAAEHYLTPINGAEMWVGSRAERGYNGCRTEPFSTAEVPLVLVPAGSFVCMRTNEGRISQFQIVSLTGSPLVMRIMYTTWSN